jgi:dUTP pyrophosphatase
VRLLYRMPIFKPSTNAAVNDLYTQVKGRTPNSSANFAILLVSPQTPELASIYAERAVAHNSAFHTNIYADAGFDLFTPDRTVFTEDITAKFIDMRIKAEMFYCDIINDIIMPSAFVVHPRSSISKTPLMLANHTGIIDSGYRGSLIGAFRWLPRREDNASEYVVDASTRLVQICHPTLCPILILNADNSQLSSSQRGSGGFGSTGV